MTDSDPPTTKREGTWTELDALALRAHLDMSTWVAEHAADYEKHRRRALRQALDISDHCLELLDHLGRLAKLPGGPTVEQRRIAQGRITQLREAANALLANQEKAT